MIDVHQKYLREAIRAAGEGLASGNPPFGCILVTRGAIRVEAFNTSKTESNFLLHGEINCLMKARELLTPEEISESVLYASNEPCPMCCGAIYWSGIRTVVYGSRRETLTKLRSFGLNVACREILQKGTDPVEVIGPMCEDEIVPLYKKFYSV